MPNLKEEQKKAVYHETGDLLVSASAGSGKTFVMISRIIRLISEKKAGVKDVLCVTFTEASAADMKNKLKKAIIEKINETGDEFLISQLKEIPTADISTLHSFCMRLIKTYFYVAGVSPDFEIADENYAVELKGKALQKLFRKLYSAEGIPELPLSRKIAERYAVKRKDGELKKYILSLYDYASSEADPEEFLKKSLQYYADENFDDLLKDYKSRIDKELIKYSARFVAYSAVMKERGLAVVSEADEITDDLEKLVNNPDIYAIKNFADYKKSLRFGRNLSEEDEKLKKQAQSTLKKLKAFFVKVNASLTDYQTDKSRNSDLYSSTETVCGLVKLFGEYYSELKKDENLLDFNDLEKYATEILSDKDVNEAVSEKYKYVFVDEYQDINGVQEKIISLIARDNLFMVGDVKQSIYGFRGCKSDFFSRKYEKMSKTDNTVLLNHNFRSAKKVINMVNSVFSFSMTERDFGVNYKDNSMLVSGGVYPEEYEGRADVTVINKIKSETKEKEVPRIYDILKEAKEEKTERSATAILITDIINKEIFNTYYDISERKEKRIKYGDIAILVRSKAGVGYERLIKTLKANGIPVSSADSESVVDYPETQLLINYLELIDNSVQDVPLATLLLSPYFSFTEEDLCDICAFYRENAKNPDWTFKDAFTYYAEKGDGELKEKIKNFDDYISEARKLADFTSASDVLEKFIADKSVKAAVLAGKDGERGLNRIKALLSFSKSSDRKLSVGELLRKIKNNPDGLTSSETSGEDCVNVMTIHSSKGLEYPVVIVCGLEKAMNTRDESEEIMKDRNYGVALKYFDDDNKLKYETVLRGLLKLKMKDDRVKEELRLFYVALTRAKYALHLTLVSDDDDRSDGFYGADSFIDYVPRNIPVTRFDEDDFTALELKEGVRKVLIGKTDASVENRIRKNLSFEYPFMADTVLPMKISVTQANEVREEDEKKVYVISDEDTSAEKGTIAHKFMQFLNFKAPVNEEFSRMIKDGILSEEEAKSINAEKIEKAVSGSNLSDLGGDIYREKSFIAELPAKLVLESESEANVLVQGVIDLLEVSEDGARIIDYKYSAKSPEQLVKTYKKQLNLYAAAVENILKIPVKSKTILSLLTGEKAEID